MNARKPGAVTLIVAGVAGLVFGTFSFGRKTQTTSMGPMEVVVSKQRTFKVPLWAGAGAIAVGVVRLLAWRNEKA